MIDFKPFDIVVIDGEWYMPHHWLIKWRGFNNGVHCVTLMNESGEIWNPTFLGIHAGFKSGKTGHISYYTGRRVTIHRYKGSLDFSKLIIWGNNTVLNSSGYDFIKQWLLGFVLGITDIFLVNDETKWTCAEFPYWAFQDNGYNITARDETLPMPRLFRFNDHFDCIFEGVL